MERAQHQSWPTPGMLALEAAAAHSLENCSGSAHLLPISHVSVWGAVLWLMGGGLHLVSRMESLLGRERGLWSISMGACALNRAVPCMRGTTSWNVGAAREIGYISQNCKMKFLGYPRTPAPPPPPPPLLNMTVQVCSRDARWIGIVADNRSLCDDTVTYCNLPWKNRRKVPRYLLTYP